MKHFFLHIIKGILPVAALCCTTLQASADEFTLPADYNSYRIFDKTVFYDGYITDRVVDADLEDGVIRFTNYHYSLPVDVDKLLALGDDLRLEVIIGALCDNYDRLGRVMLAFPEAGHGVYDPETVERIEIARFITPFMNKNRIPDEVPYIYELDDLRQLLSDETLLEGREVWMEVELFGIPYAANNQVRGCAGRSDVFSATVSFAGHHPEVPSEAHALGLPAPGSQSVLTPITVSKCEIHGNVNLNNYKEAATDTLGVTTKTYTFEVPADLTDAQINFILTNHGAAENGEEYIRRQHLVYVDGEIAMVYTPGGVSCEPYRRYNTQTNGIYGTSIQDDWEEWNNWCPGQAVPIRRIRLGAMKSGVHTLMIRVPDAEFYGADGDFRPSAYLQGVTSGKVADPSGVDELPVEAGTVLIRREGNDIVLCGEKTVSELRVYSYDGRLLEGVYRPSGRYSLSHLQPGHYIVVATAEDGQTAFVKVMI